ncbi:fascin domain-containing protein [Novipirellula artificiosorum]|uniref:Fascin domain-containing protein n=1 Tax=Novipirellula artificiosorum TaxID=2528016 RepID=A0A5C6E3I1_9BACT|nr:hypothetical protein [Novipirellula artificiosorum]TWU42537.1 hypothetical protein Poly41_08340 [Novipirellula artificiosorum]
MQVAILSADGNHFVRASRDGTLDAVAEEVSTWEMFEYEEYPDGRFSLKTLASHPAGSQFVRARGGGGGLLSADRAIASDHEKFTKNAIANGQVAIQTSDGRFWRAKNLGGAELDCHATVVSSWEAFTIKSL